MFYNYNIHIIYMYMYTCRFNPFPVGAARRPVGSRTGRNQTGQTLPELALSVWASLPAWGAGSSARISCCPPSVEVEEGAVGLSDRQSYLQ